MSNSKIARSAITGRYAPISEARRKPDNYVVETVKRPTPQSAPAKPKK